MATKNASADSLENCTICQGYGRNMPKSTHLFNQAFPGSHSGLF